MWLSVQLCSPHSQLLCQWHHDALCCGQTYPKLVSQDGLHDAGDADSAAAKVAAGSWRPRWLSCNPAVQSRFALVPAMLSYDSYVRPQGLLLIGCLQQVQAAYRHHSVHALQAFAWLNNCIKSLCLEGTTLAAKL